MEDYLRDQQCTKKSFAIIEASFEVQKSCLRVHILQYIPSLNEHIFHIPYFSRLNQSISTFCPSKIYTYCNSSSRPKESAPHMSRAGNQVSNASGIKLLEWAICSVDQRGLHVKCGQLIDGRATKVVSCIERFYHASTAPHFASHVSFICLIVQTHSDKMAKGSSTKNKYSVILPTYNERQNLPVLVQMLYDVFTRE